MLFEGGGELWKPLKTATTTTAEGRKFELTNSNDITAQGINSRALRRGVCGRIPRPWELVSPEGTGNLPNTQVGTPNEFKKIEYCYFSWQKRNLYESIT